jgi:hypothetical protein
VERARQPGGAGGGPPFWLLDEGDTSAVLGLAEWLAARAGRLDPYEALVALERICRELESEAEGRRS